jgi:RHS repeat-associated protein
LAPSYEIHGTINAGYRPNMPEFAQADPHSFWVAADAYERANGRTYTELQIALPRELEPAQRKELAREATKELLRIEDLGQLQNWALQAAVYRATDHLGSLSYTMDSSGNIQGSSTVLPFGQLSSNTTGDTFVFTDHERDSENGTDATLFRHYNSSQGRWMSPDPSNSSYNLLDPQSLNRYAYLTNRPMAQTDRLGLDDDDDDDDDDSGFWGGLSIDLSNLGQWFSNFFGGGGGGSEGPPQGGIPTFNIYFNNAGTSQPNGGQGYLDEIQFNNGLYGVGGTASVLVDASPGADQDGASVVPTSGTGGSSGNAGGSSAPNNCSTATPSLLPHGVDIVGGAELTAGTGFAGGTIQGSAGQGWFSSPAGGVNSGHFTSFVAAGRVGPYGSGNIPQGDTLPLIAGLYAGLGAGLFTTNARNVSQLNGPFTSITVSTPIGSLNVSYGGGIWSGAVMAGPGDVGALTITNTPTKAGAVHGPW